MVSTYYIYYIVTTYYVINGITIINYLHNVNANNGGNAWRLSTLSATVKGVYCVCTVAITGRQCTLHTIGKGNG